MVRAIASMAITPFPVGEVPPHALQAGRTDQHHHKR